ncbi:MAG: hypothetical protein NW207_00155, partial [Cytophagales bacterium]|nr:hypothetical protein [Cytophagales bacterium]
MELALGAMAANGTFFDNLIGNSSEYRYRVFFEYNRFTDPLTNPNARVFGTIVTNAANEKPTTSTIMSTPHTMVFPWCDNKNSFFFRFQTWEESCDVDTEYNTSGCGAFGTADDNYYYEPFTYTFTNQPVNTIKKEFLKIETSLFYHFVEFEYKWYHDIVPIPDIVSSTFDPEQNKLVSLCEGQLVTIYGHTFSNTCPSDVKINIHTLGNAVITHNIGAKTGTFFHTFSLPANGAGGAGRRLNISKTEINQVSNLTITSNLSADHFYYHSAPQINNITTILSTCKGGKDIEIKFDITGHRGKKYDAADDKSLLSGYAISFIKINPLGDTSHIVFNRSITTLKTVAGYTSKRYNSYDNNQANENITISPSTIEPASVSRLGAGNYHYQIKNYYNNVGSQCYVSGSITVPEPYSAFTLTQPTAVKLSGTDYHANCLSPNATITNASASHTGLRTD